MSSKEELPTGWQWCEINTLLEPLQDGRTIHQGWSPRCEKHPVRSDGEWGVLKTTAIQSGSFQAEHNKALPTSLEPRPRIEVRAGDLLITSAGPRSRCGIPCLVKVTRSRLMLSGKMYRFRANESTVLPEYLEAYLLSDTAQCDIDRMKTGGDDSGLNLTLGRFKRLQIPLPPLPTQKHIADRISELFSDIDEGERALARVKTLTEKYRRSVFKAAVSGALTRDWRENNQSRCESKEELLALISNLRRSAWIENSGSGTYREPKMPDMELPALEAGWVWVTLEHLIHDGPTNGYSPRASPGATGTKSLKLTATIGGNMLLNQNTTKHLDEVIDAKSKYWLQRNDILIQRGNSLEHVGTAAIFDGPAGSFIYPDLMMRVRSCSPVFREWLCRYINSLHGKNYIKKHISGTAGSMPKINGRALRSMPIPIAHPDELAEALNRLRSMCANADGVESCMKQARGRSAAIRGSVLKAAFLGDLVNLNRRITERKF